MKACKECKYNQNNYCREYGWKIENKNNKCWYYTDNDKPTVSHSERFTKEIVTQELLIKEKDLFMETDDPISELFAKYPEKFDYLYGRTTYPNQTVREIIWNLRNDWIMLTQEEGKSNEEVFFDYLAYLETYYSVK